MSDGHDYEPGTFILDPETKKPRMNSTQCPTCVGAPGNKADLRPGRIQELVRKNTGPNALGLICHETMVSRDGEPPQEAFCRWMYETRPSNYQRICERLARSADPLDGFTVVSPPDLKGLIHGEQEEPAAH